MIWISCQISGKKEKNKKNPGLCDSQNFGDLSRLPGYLRCFFTSIPIPNIPWFSLFYMTPTWHLIYVSAILFSRFISIKSEQGIGPAHKESKCKPSFKLIIKISYQPHDWRKDIDLHIKRKWLKLLFLNYDK